MLDLDRLRAFTTVARLENVSRAAEALHISQSPLSRQIIALEEELGLTLFARERRRLRLTSAGRAFLSDAEALLRAAASVEERARAAARGGPARISIGYVAGAVYAGALTRELERLRSESPAATLELRAIRSGAQVAALESGEIDMGYAYAPAPAKSGVSTSLLFEEPFVLASARRGDVRRLLASEPLITHPDWAERALLDACARLTVRPRIGIEATDPAVVLSLVGGGLGIALVQASLRRLAPPGVRFLKLPEAFGLKLQIHRLTRRA